MAKDYLLTQAAIGAAAATTATISPLLVQFCDAQNTMVGRVFTESPYLALVAALLCGLPLERVMRNLVDSLNPNDPGYRPTHPGLKLALYATGGTLAGFGKLVIQDLTKQPAAICFFLAAGLVAQILYMTAPMQEAPAQRRFQQHKAV